MSSDAGWPEVLDRIEASIADAECGEPAHPLGLRDGAATLGALPDALRERAEALVRRAARLDSVLSTRLDAIDAELGRHSPRRRTAGPPAPSHLDHMA